MLGVINKLKGMEAKVVATVHDSIELIAPKQETREVVKLVKDELENYHYLRDNFNIEFKVPLAVDIEVGSSFGNGVEYEL